MTDVYRVGTNSPEREVSPREELALTEDLLFVTPTVGLFRNIISFHFVTTLQLYIISIFTDDKTGLEKIGNLAKIISGGLKLVGMCKTKAHMLWLKEEQHYAEF